MKIGNKEVHPKITTMIALNYASSQGIPAIKQFEWMPKEMTPIQYIGLFVAACNGQVTHDEVTTAIDDNPETYTDIVTAVINEILDPNRTAETTPTP